MTSDEYVELVVEKYAVENGVGSPAYRVASTFIPSLGEWAGEYLLGIAYSGSYAKGTAISLGTDVDLFISVGDMAGMSMKDIYWSLFRFLEQRQFQPEARNVAVGVECGGMEVDLVPGRRRANSQISMSLDTAHLSRKERGEGGAPTGSSWVTPNGDHTLYRRKADSWMQTNVEEHIQFVSRSGRTGEIRALKVWRERHGLEFPSFYLELTVIEALRGRRGKIAENVMEVLRYISERLEEARVVDPANSNNVVSEDLDTEEKRTVAAAARKSLGMRRWELILW